MLQEVAMYSYTLLTDRRFKVLIKGETGREEKKSTSDPFVRDP